MTQSETQPLMAKTDKLEACPTDLIAFKWAETLSAGEQSVLLGGSLRRLQDMINASRDSVAILPQLTELQEAYNQGIEDAKCAIRAESQGGGYWAATYINAIARRCSPFRYTGLPAHADEVQREHIRQAIADMQEGRESHLQWAAHLRNTSREDCQGCSDHEAHIGDAAYHDEWIAKYDNVIRVLSSPVAVTVDAEAKAKEIADYLFTNGFGDKGDRLNLYRNGDVYLGGWDEDSVVRGIVSYLNDYTAQPAPSDSSIQAAAARHYFCSCGGALTAEEYIEHYFERGHDRGNPAVRFQAAAAEICAYFGDTELAMGGHVNANGVATILSKWLGSAAVGEHAELQRRLFDECVTANWDPERKNTFAEEIAHLHEELSEAFRAWRKYKDCEVREVNGKLEGVPIEFADVVIGLFYNAELHGFNLLEAVERKHEFNLKRNYVAEGRQLHAAATPTSTQT